MAVRLSALRAVLALSPEMSTGTHLCGARSSVVIKALCYKPNGHGFETRRGEGIFPIDLILPAAL
jgi:hypothetical protein